MAYEKSARATALPPETPVFYADYKEPFREVKDGYGYYGVLATTADKNYVQCHICGFLFRSLSQHVRNHGISTDQYKKDFGLFANAALVGEDVRQMLVNRYVGKVLLSKANHFKAREGLKEYWRKVKAGEIERTGNKEWSLQRRNKHFNCPEQLIEKIQVLAKELGRAPTTKEWTDRTGHGHMVLKTVFGSYNEGIKIAGLVPTDHWKDRPPLMSREQVIESFQNYYATTGRVPRTSDMDRGNLPGRKTVSRHFKSIYDLREAAGLPELVAVGGGTTRQYVEATDDKS